MIDKFDVLILDVKGDVISVDGENRSMTLRDIVEPALLEQYADEASLPAEQKVRRWKLFQLVSGGAAFDTLKSEDVTLIKQLIGKRYVTLLVGRSYDIIDLA